MNITIALCSLVALFPLAYIASKACYKGDGSQTSKAGGKYNVTHIILMVLFTVLGGALVCASLYYANDAEAIASLAMAVLYVVTFILGGIFTYFLIFVFSALSIK